jgi:hypothetical protein
MSPAIEFHTVNSLCAYRRVRSSNDVIRFRLRAKRGLVTFDGDWGSTKWYLAPAARDAIFARWDAERSRLARDCGGGKWCVVFSTPVALAEAWREFLLDLLSQPSSWLVFNRDGQLVLPSSLPPVVPAQSADLSFRLENQNGN